MKNKLAVLAFLLGLGGSLFAQEGTPIKGLFGAGPPNANIAHVIGTEYIDTTTSLLYICTAVTLTATVSSCTWTAGGGVSANSPIPANQAQGPTYNVVNYGAKGDAQKIKDGVTAGGGSKTVTSATAPFKSADVGKKIVCAAAGNSTPLMPIATILSVTATVATTDTTDNGGASSLQCIWYTKDDKTAFTSATTAATPTTNMVYPNVGPTLGTPPGSVYCPEGQYAVSGRIFHFVGTGSSVGTNFVGAGKDKCIIYIIPGTVDPNDGFAVLMDVYNAIGSTMSGFSVDGLVFGSSFTHPIVQFNQSLQFRMQNFSLTNMATSGNRGTLDFLNSSNGVIEDGFVQGGNSLTTDFACGFSGTSSIHVKNLTCSNHAQSAYFNNNGIRTVAGDNAPVIENPVFDECGSTTLDCTVFSVSGAANIFGGWLGVGNTNRSAVNVDGTSRLWLSNVNVGQFGPTTVVSNGITIASGGEVNAAMSDIRGNGSGANGVAVTGPAGAKFNDIGGNRIRNCVNSTCTDITAATYATQGFTGGIVPKATVTHTPNTCYAVTGNLLATAQNLCTFLNDQNYQILNVTAQSGGTTPAASACTGAPVITFTDGTRTTTLTMTTAKTSWSSAVDAYTGANQVFASGTTLTISIGANTCATPPANVSVSYVLQSVLNP